MEIKDLIEKQGTAFEEFKKANDARLNEIEKKGAADPLLTEQVNKLNTALEEQKKAMEALQTAASRPGAGAGEEGKEKPELAEHKKAFIDYLRKGNDANLGEMQTKALSVGSDPDGGYLVTPTMANIITKIVNETSPLRALASVQTISSDSLDTIDDVQLMGGGWTGEQDSRSETTTAQIGKRNIPVHELYANPRATQKLLDDANINIEQWLAEKIAEKLSLLENTAFVSGNGVSKPRGFLTYAAGTSWGQVQQVSSGTSADFGADDLISLFYTLKEPYQKNATFLMARATLANVRQMKGSDGQYIWQPALALGAPDLILGRPVVQASDMEAIGAASLSVAVADWKQAYQIVDRIGIRTLRDPFSAKPYVQFYTTKRVGGDVLNFEAVKLLKLS
jgi:HK97 family phage major capsid protein